MSSFPSSLRVPGKLPRLGATVLALLVVLSLGGYSLRSGAPEPSSAAGDMPAPQSWQTTSTASGLDVKGRDAASTEGGSNGALTAPAGGGAAETPTEERSSKTDPAQGRAVSSGGGKAVQSGLETPRPSQLRILSLTKPVRPGAEASLIAETDPGVECQIGVYYQNGRSTSPELSPKAADETGLVSWRWRVEDTARIDEDESSVLVLCSVGRDLLSRGAPLIPAD